MLTAQSTFSYLHQRNLECIILLLTAWPRDHHSIFHQLSCFHLPSLKPPSSQLAHVLIAARDPSSAIPQAHAALETKMRQLDRGRSAFHNLAFVYSQVSQSSGSKSFFPRGQCQSVPILGWRWRNGTFRRLESVTRGAWKKAPLSFAARVKVKTDHGFTVGRDVYSMLLQL